MEQRQLYLDLLRVASVFAVIVLHIASPIILAFPNVPKSHWITANIFESITRFCVPVLFMISGALTLSDTRNFQFSYLVFKRILRILIPFLIWSVIYTYFLLDLQGKTSDFNLLNAIYAITHKPAHYHLWFLYTLLGLYLLIPLLGVFVNYADDSKIQYFLILWFIIGVCNPFFNTLFKYHLPIFSLPNNYEEVWLHSGYFVLGFYLSRKSTDYETWKLIALITIGIAITAWMTNYFSQSQGKASHLFYMYTSPNVLLTSIGVFMIAKKLTPKLKALNYKAQQLLILMSEISFGIYLMHLVIHIQVGTYLRLDTSMFAGNPTHPLIGVTLTSVSIFVISAILTYMIRQIPFIGKWVT